MVCLLEYYNSKEPHELKDLAKFHAKFEKIHPFQDGHERVEICHILQQETSNIFAVSSEEVNYIKD